MPGCAVAGCRNFNKNTKGSDIKYFRFPKNGDMAAQWVNACKRKDKINLKNACICSVHFAEGCSEIPLRQRMLQYCPKNSRHLKPDAIPTLRLPGTSKATDETNCSLRLEKIECKEEYMDITIKDEPLTSVATTSTPSIFNKDNNLLNKKIKTLEEENVKLKQEVEDAKNVTIKRYEDALAQVFTPGQIEKLLNPNKEIDWTSEEIASAISLYSVSPLAYRYLILAHNYPLPEILTLRNIIFNLK
ncbi:unnamed protein product [Brassicogethes aeneus]|uniref:THAP-type domain-containing protein n=1 Tax=Brassicogethes aeneus TaxID=1431903 RepID=A0A9P0AV98_BRAAE|nr:unnamed protein product [Brassicogethes aeneus]